MITFDDVSLRYGHKEIYRNLSCMIRDNDRIALIGPNGAGKTTFYRMLMGVEDSDTGKVERSKGLKCGYLPQEQLVSKGRTLYEETESVFEYIIDVRSELEKENHLLQTLSADSDEYKRSVEKIGSLEHSLEELESHKIRSRVEKVLLGLGFKMSDMDRDTGEFSGGWQMRIALARLILMEPDILLLDEPTNHLDITSQRWLENELKRYQGAYIIISHDRAFIDELCTKTFALSGGQMDVYNGNYSFYLKDSEARKEQREKAFQNQQKKIKKTEEFIERFRYKNTKAKQVQSRIKALDKLDRLESEEDTTQSVHFKFPVSRRSGQVVVKLEDASKTFDQLQLFKGISLQVERGEKIAVVGPNGCGKSTLARMMSEIEPLTGGSLNIGHQVDIGFFAQQQADTLDENLDVISTLETHAKNRDTLQLRSVLGSFLFRGDDIYKSVKVLSGGEKSRLALACILCSPNNCLILDEPTNHIDINTKDILQTALLDYEGTCIIVSHDRAFLDPIVDRVIEVTENRIRNFPGNVSEYLLKVEKETLDETAPAAKKAKTEKDTLSPKEKRKIRASLQQELSPLKKKLSELENKIMELEEQKSDLESKLSDEQFFKQGDQAKEAVEKHRKTEELLKEAEGDWETAAEKITEAEEEIEKYK